MSNFQKAKSVLFALAMIASGVLLLVAGQSGIVFVALALSVLLMAYGIKKLAFYLTMARHMVGGKMLLYLGIIALDVGTLALTFLDSPNIIVVLYLVGAYALSGVLSVLRSREAQKLGGSWKLRMCSGVVSLLVAATCIVFIQDATILLYVFAAGLIYSACLRIIQTLRTTDIIYIA